VLAAVILEAATCKIDKCTARLCETLLITPAEAEPKAQLRTEGTDSIRRSPLTVDRIIVAAHCDTTSRSIRLRPPVQATALALQSHLLKPSYQDEALIVQAVHRRAEHALRQSIGATEPAKVSKQQSKRARKPSSGQKEMLVPIAGKKPAKAAATKKPSVKPRHKRLICRR
jgi:hypothetical protein